MAATMTPIPISQEEEPESPRAASDDDLLLSVTETVTDELQEMDSVSDETNVRANALTMTVQSYQERRNTLLVLIAMTVCNVLQAVAVVVVLVWYSARNQIRCDSPLPVWAVFHALLLLASLGVTWRLFGLAGDSPQAPGLLRWRSTVDVFTLVWFVLGNMWTFGSSCKACTPRLPGLNPGQDLDPPVYWLCFSLIIMHYAILCAPCIGIIVLVPILCLCLPCLIKLANYVNVKNRQRMNAWIKELPTEVYSEETFEGDATCSICLSEYEDQDEIRRMPSCPHMFHASCIDEWLIMNPSCPVCRTPLQQQQAGNPSRQQAPTPEPLHAAAVGLLELSQLPTAAADRLEHAYGDNTEHAHSEMGP